MVAEEGWLRETALLARLLGRAAGGWLGAPLLCHAPCCCSACAYISIALAAGTAPFIQPVPTIAATGVGGVALPDDVAAEVATEARDDSGRDRTPDPRRARGGVPTSYIAHAAVAAGARIGGVDSPAAAAIAGSVRGAGATRCADDAVCMACDGEAAAAADPAGDICASGGGGDGAVNACIAAACGRKEKELGDGASGGVGVGEACIVGVHTWSGPHEQAAQLSGCSPRISLLARLSSVSSAGFLLCLCVDGYASVTRARQRAKTQNCS